MLMTVQGCISFVKNDVVAENDSGADKFFVEFFF